MSIKICIDPGHGGSDPGNINFGVREKDVTLPSAMYLKDALERCGFTVLMTHISDSELVPGGTMGQELTARAGVGNQNHVDLFFSWHTDSADNPDANGVGVFVYPSTRGTVTEAIAQKIVASVSTATGQFNRGVKFADFAVLRETNMASVLMEAGFASNADESKKLIDCEFQKTQAEAVTKAICEHFGVAYISNVSNPLPTSPVVIAPTPQPEPASVKTPIFDGPVATVEQMRAYLKQKNPDAPDYAQMYINIGAKYGIAGDKVFCQSIKETGRFTFKRPDGTPGQVKPEQNNFCGLGALTGGGQGATFATQEQGIEAQFQHVFGYATKDNLPAGVTLLDPRFDLLTQIGRRGIAPYWEDLSNKWAVPKEGCPPNTYGEDIVSMWKEMCAIVVPPADPNQWKKDSIQWMKDTKLIDSDHDPDSAPTYAEMGLILKRLKEDK